MEAARGWIVNDLWEMFVLKKIITHLLFPQFEAMFICLIGKYITVIKQFEATQSSSSSSTLIYI